MKTFHKYLFFTRTKLNGSFTYEGLFQIYPMDVEGMPKSTHQEYFPNYIEFFTTPADDVKLQTPYPEINDSFSHFKGPDVKKELFLMLLTTGTNHLFFSYTDNNGFWGVPFYSDNIEDFKITESVWCTPFYGSKVFEGLSYISDFSNLKIQKIQQIHFSNYFFGKINIDLHFGDPITIPNNLKYFIESYYSLDKEERIIINNAMLHLKNGVEIILRKKTLALVSLFTCLETMVSIEYRGIKPKTCEKCNQPVYSVTKKFREFLSNYVSNNNSSKEKFNKLYKLRSSIIHTGKPLDSELLYSEIPYQDKRSEELQTREVAQICRAAIVKWVIRKNIEKLKQNKESTV